MIPWGQILASALAVALALAWGQRQPAIGLVWGLGCAIGWLLRRGGFGFSGPLRRALDRGEPGALLPVAGLLALLIVGSGLLLGFAGSLGIQPRPLRAPLNLSLAMGAFAFGAGMLMARRCASGTLAAAAPLSWSWPVTFAGLLIGVFFGSLQRPQLERLLPALPPAVLLDRLPLGLAVLIQLGLLLLVSAGLARLLAHARGLSRPSEAPWVSPDKTPPPHPSAGTVIGLAGLLLLLFAVGGEPWKVLWGLALSGAHLAQAAGWDPQTSLFWAAPARLRLLADPEPWWWHEAVVVNLGVIYGAAAAGPLWAVPNGSTPKPRRPSPHLLLRQATGGLLMGWGGFLAYGCNISGFLGGVMSFSLHGWLWLAAALAGAALWLRVERWLERWPEQESEQESARRSKPFRIFDGIDPP